MNHQLNKIDGEELLPHFFSIEDFPEVLPTEVFVKLFEKLGAQPRWVTSNGKRVLQLLGLCHHSKSGSHSVIFDIHDQYKCHCFSSCGTTFLWWNYIARMMEINSQAAKEWVLDWLQDENIEVTNIEKLNFTYEERVFELEEIEPVEPIPKEVIKQLYANFDNSLETVSKLVWAREEEIDPLIMIDYDVAYYPENGSIILPHHNINGDIVGLYERSFKPLRKEVKIGYPDIPYQRLIEYPRAKYVPLLKEEKFRTEEKASWSFPNSFNLYGLHKALKGIKETGIAIVFEGAKSVMLARQYGYYNAVATHTFGIHPNHINMLISAGAKEIILAFDKQYKSEGEGKDWELYDKRTHDLAQKVKKHVEVSRIIDRKSFLAFRDAPIDHGKEIFEKLYISRENLTQEKKQNKEDPFVFLKRQVEARRLISKEADKYNEYFVL